MSSPNVEEFAFDEINEEEIYAHHLNITQVDQILTSTHIIVPNKKDRTGLYLVIGRDSGGACIAAPIQPTTEPKIWRPVTAWPCNTGQLTQLMKREGKK